MPEHDEGRVRFLDGMRVTIEHMEHLQALWLSAAVQLREAVGTGRVSHGLRVEPAPGNKVKVGRGLAFDRKGRPLALEQEAEVAPDFGASKTIYLALVHARRTGGLVNGVPTLVFNEPRIETRAAAPPYTDDSVVFAELHAGDGEVSVVQRGEWYMPPLDHGHSGEFKLDADMRWRYDGHALASEARRFDSGFIPVRAGGEARLVHGLKTTHLVVQLQARREDGVITTEGLGDRFWYELVGEQEVRLARRRGGDAEGGLELRVMLWPAEQGGASPLLPVADAGDDLVVAFGESFALDASRSRAFGGRKLVKYIWQQFS